MELIVDALETGGADIVIVEMIVTDSCLPGSKYPPARRAARMGILSRYYCHRTSSCWIEPHICLSNDKHAYVIWTGDR